VSHCCSAQRYLADLENVPSPSNFARNGESLLSIAFKFETALGVLIPLLRIGNGIHLTF